MNERIKVSLIGNPNVGKSTIFNLLTGMKQHTGNWTGKTVSIAQGSKKFGDKNYIFTDLPGTYSLFYNSQEEKTSSDYLTMGDSDLTLIVCDATKLERDLILALQCIEVCKKSVLCLNMSDEAEKQRIIIDTDKLSSALGIPVIKLSARKKDSSKKILNALSDAIEKDYTPNKIEYVPAIADAIEETEKHLEEYDFRIKRWIALNVIEGNVGILNNFNCTKRINCEETLSRYGYGLKTAKEKISYSFVRQAENIALQAVSKSVNTEVFSKVDRIITGKYTSFLIIALLLILIFWMTIVFSNYPSDLLSKLFDFGEKHLIYALRVLHCPKVLSDVLINGIYKVVGWVISVMLPPMMIFFPMFTLLEDVGYLPRLAFNVDSYFQKVNACGKQALTYCMSFGCNAAGIVSSRIIDSKKEKIVAIVTNNFIPCNGRFPILISVISIFLVGSFTNKFDTFLCAVFLAFFIIFSVMCAMEVSKILSKTILKSEKTSYTLELPPYRKPQIGKIIVRSVFDRTLFVLGRAVAVAAPAGLVIWLLANIRYGGISLLNHVSGFLDPVGRIFGMDGVILLSFILGLPANEIVIPIAVMCYMQNSNLTHIEELSALKDIFIANGWTVLTAICVLIFTIMHWPCSTSIITVYKETRSLKWTLLSVFTPTLCGLFFCFLLNLFSKIFL